MTRDELVRAFETRITRPVSIRELMQLLRVARAERVGLRRQLRALTDDGTLVLLRGRRYGLPGRMDTAVGRLHLHPDGYGFVRPEGESDPEAGDVYISAYDLQDAMHGDRVAVRVDRGRSARGRAGRVVQIVGRASARFIGRFDVDAGGRGRVIAHDPRVGQDLFVPDGEQARATPGEMVVAEITRWPTQTRGPSGRIVEVLGRLDAPGVDTRVIIRIHDIPEVHGAEALREAASLPAGIPDAEYAGRTDFRGLTTVTIDGEHARDFDDALSIERWGDGYRLGVHIADVSHYVTEGSALDRDARDRGTSVYFPERALHMLPERLAADLCSLKPGVDRLVLSCVMELDRHGGVVRHEIHDGVIRSAARLTYTEVNAALTERDPGAVARLAPVLSMLEVLREVFERLHTRRHARGAIDFDLPQPDIVLDASGLVEAIVPTERNVAHRMIEEFMLLANETVARHLEGAAVPAIYRVHDAPDPTKVDEFAAFVSSLGLTFAPGHEGVRPVDFQRLVEQLRGRPEEKPVAFLLLRTMQLARYEAVNRGHFGLALESYTHFTSPIRRYPDLVVHRQLRGVVQRRATALSADDDHEQVAAIARISSERERRAMAAERALVQWKKARFMADKVGEDFEGVVTGVAPYGFFVELAEHFVEGLVHVGTLAGGPCLFDEARLELRHASGTSYRLGDRVRVRVVGVDLTRHQIGLGLVDVLAQASRSAGRARGQRGNAPAAPVSREPRDGRSDRRERRSVARKRSVRATRRRAGDGRGTRGRRRR